MRLFRRTKLLSPLEGYNLWSKSYHVEDNPIKRMSDDFILERLENLDGKAVLDAGCGTGKICLAAIARGASYVKGIDLSPGMIAEAKKNCPQAEFECADLVTSDLEKYDVVICGLVLGHIEQLEPALTKLIMSLKPNGQLILTDFHPYQTMMKAKRTFKYNGKTYEVRHSLHTLDEYYTLQKNLNVTVTQLEEPVFKDHPVIFGIHGVAA
jgi:malonyl-CoA O-methyltransferase